MRILIIFILLISNSVANEITNIKNLVINKELKKYEDLIFFDSKKQQINLKDFKGKLILLNFWATWCAPCREEMPSLDKLSSEKNFNNLEILPINVGSEKISKSKIFFEEVGIKNLKIYHDIDMKLPNKLLLRGLPTTLLINKKGEEFARILGSVDFEDKKLIKWLKNFD